MLSPKEIYYKEIEVLFNQDPDITIEVNRDRSTVKLFVESEEKATALAYLLPKEKTFGNESVKVIVVPANREEDIISSFRKAFDGNPVFADALRTTGLFDLNYIVFKPEIVQYRSDNTGDINGNTTTLYQEIARDVFDNGLAVFYCTEKIEVKEKDETDR